jgi:nitric oxide reductase activation protein
VREPPPLEVSAAAPAQSRSHAEAHEAARLARRLEVAPLARRRRAPDGADLDLDAAVAAAVDGRLGRPPDPRVYARLERRRRDLAVLMLLDLSASTDAVVGEGMSVIELARRAALLLGDALADSGAGFAIHGFSSNGRTEVEYHRLKDLEAAWNGEARARVAAVKARLSTRMGAALRHAARCLAHVRRDRRLVLLLTDGEPADVDAPDPGYLLHDARQAVSQLRRSGIFVFAVNLDPAGDTYARQIFGGNGYAIVDRLTHLPEALLRLCDRLVH